MEFNQIEKQEPVLCVEGLGRVYGDKPALSDLSFTVMPGEIVGLLGPNGAGKTTAMRLLTTILAPTTGRFSVLGIPHEQTEKIRARIGMLPESNGYPGGTTGLEFLTYMGELYGLNRTVSRQRASSLLKTFGLAAAMHDQIKSYSRGMRQRLGMARALINEPALLFLDEPTLGFDPIGQREMLRYIKNSASQKGTAIIISSHLMEVVEEICSRVIILNQGKTIAVNSVENLRQQKSLKQSYRFQVPEVSRILTLNLLGSLRAVESISPGSFAGEVLVTIEGPQNINQLLTALIDADIPVLSFGENERRLSDAFHTMIKEVQ